MWADPLGTVDGPLLERRIDVAACDLLRHDADALHDLASKAPEPELETLEVVHLRNRFTEPAAHLRAGVAARQAIAIVALEELVQQVETTALDHPSILHSAVHAERQRRAEHKGVILAEVVVERGMAALHRAVLHGIDHLQAGNDLAAGEGLDLELVVGHRRNALADEVGAAVQRVERLGPACRLPPLDLGHRLRDCRGSD